MADKRVPILDETRRARLEASLQQLGQQGETQQRVAKRMGVPAQYLSDVKAGRRTLTELFARRFAEEFGVDYLWLLGMSDSPQPVKASSTSVHCAVQAIPVFRDLITGDPYQHAAWDGSLIQICGLAAIKAQAAVLPYILRLESQDYLGRLQMGDLLLVAQDSNEDATIHILKQRGKLLLGRRSDGQWVRVVTGSPVSGAIESSGHIVGIVWGEI